MLDGVPKSITPLSSFSSELDCLISEGRITRLNDMDLNSGKYVLYWMQRSQRSSNNHALEYAIHKANSLEVPLVVYFGLTPDYPEGNIRHYHFMLEGLQETQQNLRSRGIDMIVRIEPPFVGVVAMAEESRMLVTDCGYLRHHRRWRQQVSSRIKCPMIQVETDAVVPVRVTSPKEEYAARTIRPKIHKHLDEYLMPVEETKINSEIYTPDISSVDLDNLNSIESRLNVDESVDICRDLRGGTKRAKARLQDFIRTKLDDYDELRNDPSKDYLSNMSPYLHFGQISPLYIALRITESGRTGTDSYLEELIVRRELTLNFCFYNQEYDSLNCLPDWARTTLHKHRDDSREYVYTMNEFEHAETHDDYWNAAQQDMVDTGKMHGYMRMYWSKKILEWTENPEAAHAIALSLNNKYELDGRDPNGFTGVAWCFGKHDRAWKERPIYGKVRYMSANGLERKFDIEQYVHQHV
ncbi:MAG: deoxyribodipyrimidine photo-lyase [Candidatus Lokiarchaeota archaeon]|nr:deoxyribodipyrimidine photo-lyase [Candidatus Lokiarchaeota archaeon]